MELYVFFSGVISSLLNQFWIHRIPPQKSDFHEPTTTTDFDSGVVPWICLFAGGDFCENPSSHNHLKVENGCISNIRSLSFFSGSFPQYPFRFGVLVVYVQGSSHTEPQVALDV